MAKAVDEQRAIPDMGRLRKPNVDGSGKYMIRQLGTERGKRASASHVARWPMFKVTTHAAEAAERPLDLVDRDFAASSVGRYRTLRP